MFYVLKEYHMPARPPLAKARIILEFLPDNQYHPFATHWQNLQTNGRSHGHYFNNLDEAIEDYNDRVGRSVSTILTTKPVVITLYEGEYRVPGPDGTEAQAYYASDEEDAINTFRAIHGDKPYNIRRVYNEHSQE